MVDMAIYDFLANLKGGGARSNLFRVMMSFPLFAVETGEETKTMSFLCKAAQLPSSTTGLIEVPFRGRQLKLAGDKVFEEWTITVMNDTDFMLKNAFERWQNAINEHRSNQNITNPQDYMTKAAVEQLNRNGDILKTYEFVGVWPSNVDAIELSAESVDEIQEFTVTLQYQFWESDTTS